ncbi:glycosyltransferase [Mucilaginibacter sp. L196]|uniref:glycosyltransferase family 2 protein n=1 Tax=Mucilaginibacter sp. L196 TaxID=1641870 RepID=UPI00131D252D|nr:glycosyltransferase [Mucilaginibacter sp. L196]
MNYPDIDVIIAVYNGEKYIEEAIVSVQAQSWKQVNIIIADDGSTDNTLLIISELSKTDSRIKILAGQHQGVSATLNAAINYSAAGYIAFLDADDLWHEEKLEKQMQVLTKSVAKICFCLTQEFESFNQGGHKTHSARPEPLKGYAKTSFLGERSIFKTYGLFDKNVSIGDFVDWFSRIIRAEEPVIMLDEVLTFRRVHQHNTTASAPKNAFLKLIKTHLDEKRKNAG